MPKFTHLHVHSHYSLLDGLPKIDELLDYVQELGMDSVAVTDHGVMYGAVELYKKAKKRGIKPIFGCEVYVALENMTDQRPGIDQKRYHLVLLVKDEEGYKNLVKMVTKAHLEGFYYKPRIDEDLLKKHSKGLIGLSACVQGKIPQLIIAKKLKEAEELAKKYQEIFGKDNFYLEIQDHPNVKEQKNVNNALISISKKTGIPLVATCDTHYLKPDDAEAQDILMLINTGADPNDPERLTMKQDDFSLKSPEEMERLFKETPEAIKNTQKIKDSCNFEFELKKARLPYFPAPDNKTADDYLRELCYLRIEERYPKKEKEIIDRLEFELSVIKQTGFAGYFLIVQDFVRWAKDNRIVVGPGRGSASGSLASYVLGITNVDPLKYNLLFERFLNPERVAGLPDIDLDFTDRRRDEVISYVADKYGRDKVAQIITFGTMAARAAIRDVGRAMSVPYSFCDKLAKMIPMQFTLDETLNQVKEFKDIYKEDENAKKLIDLARKLEGCARHASTHACGVVISKDPLSEIVPLQHPTQGDENIVTQYEMHSIEDLGLLKMDFLGLKNLTIIEDTLSRVYVIRGEKIDIEKLPQDDKETYKLLQDGKTAGVFQLEGGGMTRYLMELKPTEFEDIIAMVSLFRPGPMELIPEYIARKHKRKRVEYMHPKLKPILENTYGIMIYQEQLMQVARELGGFTMGEADVLRKAVGKKIKELLLEQKEKLVVGMAKNEIKKEVAEKIWEWILPFASYGFNRSHAAAYATIAYQTAYLKTHYSVEFMASLLTSEKNDVERIGFLIGECKKMGIEVLPPDVNESLQNFTVVPKENKIRFGLTAIKNVGTNIVEAIVQERKANGQFKSLTDFISRINSKDFNKKSFESMVKSGVFDKLGERNQLLYNMEKILEFNRENQKTKLNSQKSLFAETVGFNNNGIRLDVASPISKIERLSWEKELLGLFVTAHPLEDYKKIFERKVSPLSALPRAISGTRIRAGGIIAGIKKILTKKGKTMLFMNLEDLTGRTEVVVFPSTIEKNPLIFQENKIVFVVGRVDHRDNVAKIICDEIEEIREI